MNEPDAWPASGEMKPMDYIAVRIGWVAITAARLEQGVSFIVAGLLSGERESQELLGRRWSDVLMDAVRIYRARIADARTSGDSTEADACEAFSVFLTEAARLMKERNHVLHALWTANADVVQLDGASTAIRGKGVHESREWRVADLKALVGEINEAHQRTIAELGRLIQVGALGV